MDFTELEFGFGGGAEKSRRTWTPKSLLVIFFLLLFGKNLESPHDFTNDFPLITKEVATTSWAGNSVVLRSQQVFTGGPLVDPHA